MHNQENHPVDAFMRSEFERIELNFNPAHWEQMQSMLDTVTAAEPGDRTLSFAKKILKFIAKTKWWWMSAVLLCGVIWMLMREQNSRVNNQFNHQENIENGVLKNESGGSESIEKTGVMTPRSIHEMPVEKGASDTLRKLKMPADSAKKSASDTADGNLENFIFW